MCSVFKVRVSFNSFVTLGIYVKVLAVLQIKCRKQLWWSAKLKINIFYLTRNLFFAFQVQIMSMKIKVQKSKLNNDYYSNRKILWYKISSVFDITHPYKTMFIRYIYMIHIFLVFPSLIYIYWYFWHFHALYINAGTLYEEWLEKIIAQQTIHLFSYRKDIPSCAFFSNYIQILEIHSSICLSTLCP